MWSNCLLDLGTDFLVGNIVISGQNTITSNYIQSMIHFGVC